MMHRSRKPLHPAAGCARFPVSMMGWIFAAFFLVALSALWVNALRGRKRALAKVSTLAEENTARALRELRLLEFLHALGDATLTLGGDQDAAMHRLIATGAANV